MNEEIRKKFYDQIYDRNTITQIVGAHNAIGSSLIEKNNFQGVWASGFEISTAYGLPDADILGLTEVLSEVKKIINGSQLPVLVDCDTGFGDIYGVKRTVEECETFGVSGICIEDKVYPKTNSFVNGRQVLMDADRFSEKIYSAKNSKKDSNFLIVARIESLIAGESLDDALTRAKKYKQAGADAILIHSKSKNPDEVLEFSNEWNYSLPVIIVPTTYSNINVQEIKDNKISTVIYANHGMRTAVAALDKMLAILKAKGNLVAIDDGCVSMNEIFEIQGMSKLVNFEKSVRHKRGDS